MRATADVVIVGAGIVGAACAHAAARADVDVTGGRAGRHRGRDDRGGGGQPAGVRQAAGPELDLALLSLAGWNDVAEELPADIELERKGGLVTAGDARGATALAALGAAQAEAGSRSRPSPPRSCTSTSRRWPRGSPAGRSTRRTRSCSRCARRPRCWPPRAPAARRCAAAPSSWASSGAPAARSVARC